MNDQRKPAGGLVVIGSLSKATQSRLAKAAPGKLATIPEAPHTQVLEAKGDLRKLTQRLNEVVGDEGLVAPLLTDEDGNRLIPTGRLQVRFKEPPTDAALTQFAKRHKLELAQRNKWAPAQAEFALRTDDTRYVPDVAAELQDDGNVTRAWLDTQASFRRQGA